MGRCRFESVYNDLNNNEDFTSSRCDEFTDPYYSSICPFHDESKTYWDNETIERFRTKVEESKRDKKPLNCIGYYFPTNISFRHIFSDMTMQGELRRDVKQLPYKIDINLSNSIFAGQVEFSYCTFEESLNLSGAKFEKQALFRKSIFKKRFYPRGAFFNSNVNFRWAEFTNADFHDTVFMDKANFHNTKFYEDTRLLNVRFLGKANFQDTIFYGETEFKGTVFREAWFSQNVKFQKLTKFRNVVFENGENTDFAVKDLSNVSFLGTDITRIKFNENVKWNRTNDVDDSLTLIDEREFTLKEERHLLNWDKFPDDEMYRKRLIDFLVTRFGVTSIKVDSHFEKSSDNKSVTIYELHKSTDSCQTFKRGKELGSLILNFEKIVTRIIITTPVTYETRDIIKSATLKIGGVTFEFFVRNKSDGINLFYYNHPPIESVKAIYRGLRENYEYRLRYDEAGQFFVREMELKRKYRENFSSTEKRDIPKKNHWFRRNLFSFIALYRNICNYGESSTTPLILFSIILLLSTSYWFVSSIIGLPLQKDLLITNCPEHPIFCSLERTLNDIVGFPEKGIFIDYVIRITSIIVLATLFLPFRRKFERRFRH